MNGDEHLKSYLLDDPETGPAERRSMEDHLAGCAECRRSLESYRRAKRLLVPATDAVSAGRFVERVLSKVDVAPSARAERKAWRLPAAFLALVLAVSAAAFFSMKPPEVGQDLLAGGEQGGFYEWATASGNPSDGDVLKFVLEDL